MPNILRFLSFADFFPGGSLYNCTLPILKGPLLMTSKDWSRLVGSITPNLHHSRGMIFWRLHPGWKKGLRSISTGKVLGSINLSLRRNSC